MRAAGKSAVGRELAQRLGIAFFDSDAEIERESGRQPAAWLREFDEAVFREIEHEVIARLATEESAVLALGGGAPLNEATRRALAAWTVVLLHAPDDELAARIALDSTERPPLTDLDTIAEIAHLRERRWAHFVDFANLSLDTTSAPPSRLADQIVEALRR